MATKVKIDFYRVTLSQDTNTSFHQIIQSVALSNNDESRNVAFRGVPVRLQESLTSGDTIHGDMIRIRLDKVPLKASLAGDLEVIELESDEGMGEETAFLYYAPWQVLLVQRNHFGVSVPAIAYYFQRKGNLTGPIHIDPILNQGILARFNRMGTIRKLDIRLAGIENYQLLRNKGLSGRSLAEMMHSLHAPNISLTLSMGRSPGAFIVQAVKDIVHNMLGFSNEQGHVNKIELYGRDEEFDQPLVIDLINDRMVEVINVSLDDNKRLSYQERKRAITAAWDNRLTELANLYDLPEG